MRYLVDTDWAIDYMQGRPPVVQQFDELSSQGIGLSIVSLAELYDGMLGAADVRRAEQGLQGFLDDIEEVCRWTILFVESLPRSAAGLESPGTASTTLIF